MNRVIERKDIRITPALCSSDWKSFTRSQNIKDGCAFLIVKETDDGEDGLVRLGQPERMGVESSDMPCLEDGTPREMGGLSDGG